MDVKDVECFKCRKKGYYANKCPDEKSKDGKGYFKVRQLEEPVIDKKDDKSIMQIRHSDLNRNDLDPCCAIGSSNMIWLGRRVIFEDVETLHIAFNMPVEWVAEKWKTI